MVSGDPPRCTNEVLRKKLELFFSSLKLWCQISEKPPLILSLYFPYFPYIFLIGFPNPILIFSSKYTTCAKEILDFASHLSKDQPSDNPKCQTIGDQDRESIIQWEKLININLGKQENCAPFFLYFCFLPKFQISLYNLNVSD